MCSMRRGGHALLHPVSLDLLLLAIDREVVLVALAEPGALGGEVDLEGARVVAHRRAEDWQLAERGRDDGSHVAAVRHGQRDLGREQEEVEERAVIHQHHGGRFGQERIPVHVVQPNADLRVDEQKHAKVQHGEAHARVLALELRDEAEPLDERSDARCGAQHQNAHSKRKAEPDARNFGERAASPRHCHDGVSRAVSRAVTPRLCTIKLCRTAAGHEGGAATPC